MAGGEGTVRDAAAEARYALTITPEAERTPKGEEEAVALELKAELDAYRAQSIVLELGLKTTTEIFEVGGASALDRKYQFDRHWRNARTLSLHNPLDFKSMHAGDFLLNHRLPPVDSYN